MKQTIIVPTDFSIESLHVIKTILSLTSEEETFDIILLHGIYLPNSTIDLLYFSKTSIIKQLSNPYFDEACLVIRSKFSSQINSLRKDIFNGENQSAFENYIDANHVDKAYISSNYDLESCSKRSFDLIPFIKNSRLKIDQVDLTVETSLSDKGKLAVIFANTISTNLRQIERL